MSEARLEEIVTMVRETRPALVVLDSDKVDIGFEEALTTVFDQHFPEVLCIGVPGGLLQALSLEEAERLLQALIVRKRSAL